MPSKRGRRRLRAAASDTIVFRDQAEECFRPGPDRSTRSPGDWCRVVGLDGRELEFDVSGPTNREWRSRRTDRPGEILRSFSDNRGHEDRFALVYPGRDDVQDREVTREEAVFWLKLNGYDIPSDLHRITTYTTDAAYPRLRRDWRPPSEPPPSDDDQQSRPGPSVWAVDREIIETLRAVGRRLTTEGLLGEMSRRGLNPSGSTVKKRLAELVKGRRLNNDPKARPRGYGLPGWEGSSGSRGS
jgi:hypothetical protein